MADRLTIDTSEFDRAVTQLDSLPRATLPFIRSAVQFNVTLVKNGWRSDLEGTEFAPRVPLAITYSTKELAGGIEAEVGAEKGTGNQGGVALLLEYGAPAQNLGARGFGLKNLQENVGDLERGVGRAIDDGLRAISW
jgi:hypothetical protein